MSVVAEIAICSACFIGGSVTTKLVSKYYAKSRKKKDTDLFKSLVSSQSRNYVLTSNDNLNFLSDMMSRLWDRVNIAVSNEIRGKMEPLLAEKGFKLTKIDMGENPIKFDNIVVHELEENGKSFRFNMDINWCGNCDIDISGSAVPTFGINRIILRGRMEFIMKPLSDKIPCFGAVQFSFTDRPILQLEFSGVASIANGGPITTLIDDIIHKTLSSMMVLPNRMMFKMDPHVRILDTNTAPLGIARINIADGAGFVVEKRVLQEDDIPDIYLKISVGDRTCKSSTIQDNLEPSWFESFEFILCGIDQKITIEAWDEDGGFMDPDDFLGSIETTIGELALSSGNNYIHLPLLMDHLDSGASIALNCQICPFSSDPKTYGRLLPDKNHIDGLMSIIVIGAHNLPINNEEAASFVKVTYAEKTHVSRVVKGNAVDPCYDMVLQIPLVSGISEDANPDVVLELMNGEDLTLGKVEVTYAEVTKASKSTITETREIGDGGASLEFQVSVSGFDRREERLAKMRSPLTAGAVDDEDQDQQQTVVVTVLRGVGFKSKSTFPFITEDVKGYYCKVRFGSSPKLWKTSIVKDKESPAWNEEREFRLYSLQQVINVEVYEDKSDEKSATNDVIVGCFKISVDQILQDGGIKDIHLTLDGKKRQRYLTMKCVLY